MIEHHEQDSERTHAIKEGLYFMVAFECSSRPAYPSQQEAPTGQLLPLCFEGGEPREESVDRLGHEVGMNFSPTNALMCSRIAGSWNSRLSAPSMSNFKRSILVTPHSAMSEASERTATSKT